jgi:uncharacterized protein
MPEILPALACNLDADILSAALPLFSEERVAAIEWSFDALYKVKQVPDWFSELLSVFSRKQRLIGHGVFFSLFSGAWSAAQQQWLEQLKQVSSVFPFDHVTEHFGFMTGKDFHNGAPLNVPYTATTLRIGRDRLARISDAASCPVGVENLAFSYSVEEVKRHGAFLEELVTAVNGFIILDLHNLYCQLHNFSLPFEALLKLYPLHRVREIHISGGSWEDAEAIPGKKIRRDTHDDGVPPEVFELLKQTIGLCPNLKYVVLEQLGTGLKTAASRQRYYEDFCRMDHIVKASHAAPFNKFLPPVLKLPDEIATDQALAAQQAELSHILETATGYEAAIHALRSSSLAQSEWLIEDWDPSMIETALKIAQKWKNGG